MNKKIASLIMVLLAVAMLSGCVYYEGGYGRHKYGHGHGYSNDYDSHHPHGYYRGPRHGHR